MFNCRNGNEMGEMGKEVLSSEFWVLS